MKQTTRKICAVLLLIAIIASIGISSVTDLAVGSAENITSVFVHNVLPIDLSKYNVTSKYTTSKNNPDIARYVLESPESKIEINCYVDNNILTGCVVSIVKGQVISDRKYDSLTDSAIGFLEKYQNYTKRDLSKMISMLADVDTSKNLTIVSGSTKLTIVKLLALGAEMTYFRWADTFNGVDYTFLQIGFRSGVFYSLSDTHAKYSIGDTTVNVSKEQAIAIAMKYIETYSYAMPDGSQVSDFNVTEDRTVAELLSCAVNSTVLKPYWCVKFYLNQTYPGSVFGIVVYVWANSGEVFFCGNQAGGGSASNDSIGSESAASPSPSSSSENNAAPVDIITVATTVAVVVIVASAVLIKKRSK